MKKAALAASLAAITLATPASAQQIAAETSTAYQHAIAAGYKALTLCEGIFTAGRTEAQVNAIELRGIYPEYEPILLRMRATIDRTGRSVSVPFFADLPPRRADWSASNGCTLAPIGGTARVGPAAGEARPRPANPQPWPMGDANIAPAPSPALAGLISRAFDRASYGKGETIGVVILRDGKVIGERYADGFGPFVANRTWSVAKSVAGTLVGIAVRDLRIDVQRSADIPEWRTPGDPRQAIKLDQLIRMSSGLHSDHYGNRTDALYFGGTTVTEQAAGWPLEMKPGTRFRYANNDILLAIRAVRARMKDDARYANWPSRELFGPLGMRHTSAGADWQGNFLLSSQIWSTARDLARLGQFWLQDGVWQGKRLLPAGWMRYMTTPSGPQPAEGPGYGATMWLFGPQQGLPAGSYSAQGNRGQYVMVVPGERLVIVRRGEDPLGTRFDIAKFTADVIRAGR